MRGEVDLLIREVALGVGVLQGGDGCVDQPGLLRHELGVVLLVVVFQPGERLLAFFDGGVACTVDLDGHGARISGMACEIMPRLIN